MSKNAWARRSIYASIVPLFVGYLLVILGFVGALAAGQTLGFSDRTLGLLAWFVGLLVVCGVVTFVIVVRTVRNQAWIRELLLDSVSTHKGDELVFAGAWVPSLSSPMTTQSKTVPGGFGWGLVVRVSASGVQIFKQSGSSLEEADTLEWKAVHQISAEVKRVGRREIPVLRFRVDPAGTQLRSVFTFNVTVSSFPKNVPPTASAAVELIENYRTQDAIHVALED
ncbi:hypothetical protein B7R21_18420 [Subtercola boreus]|uniref:Uncharacterized protein n=1 Tax=Subtercola boreus TaxID=120213 RepID=A0A3E0VAE1_9MICO|nr:hypothetical protein [Subtercola boreus]RFA06822.1 hypothetical protein B7R21_18420 [Subtercola boreus]